MRKYTKNRCYSSDAYLFQKTPQKILVVSSEEELKTVCNTLISNKKKFCIRAAGTGYAGGSVPIDDYEVVVKLSGFNRILQINQNDRYIDVEAGVTPFEVNRYASNWGLLYPPDPASHKVCSIGGNIATNAGGPHCYMYGVTSNYVQKIKCWIPRYQKYIEIGADSPYSLTYDLKDLFVGSEGLLGIITKARLRLRQKPPCIYTYLITFDNYLDAVKFIYDSISNGLVFAALDMSLNPYIPEMTAIDDVGAHLLISIHGGDKYVSYVKNVLKNLIKKYTCTCQESEGEELMSVRATLVRQNVRKVINLSKKPQYFLFDAVVPRSKLGDILRYLYQLAKKLKTPLINTFHAGDGNIHPTLFYNPYSEKDIKKLKIFWYAVLKKVLSLNGSITGEHGIGIEKRELFTYYEDEIILKITEAVKSFFDPNLLLNSGKVFVKKDDTLRKGIARLENEMAKTIGNSVHKKDDAYNIMDGIVVVDSHKNLNDISRPLSKYNFFIPYFPVIFSKEPILFLIKNNIPSLYSHVFELGDIIVGMQFNYNNRAVVVGKKVLKNVAGFSLKLLANYDILGEPERFFLKIYPLSNKNSQYITINFVVNSSKKLDKILRILGSKILNFIIYRSNQKYRTFIILYNHTAHINEIEKILNSMSIRYNIVKKIEELKNPFEGLEGALIIGLTTTIRTKVLEKSLGKKQYLLTNKTIIIPLKKEESVQFSQKLLNSSLSSKIEVIRYVDRKDGNTYLFTTERLSKQLEITKELVDYVKKYISLFESKKITKQQFTKDVPLIEFLSISHHLPGHMKKEINKCVRCGLCMSECPLYNQKRDDIFSPRGLILLLTELSPQSKNNIQNILTHCRANCNMQNPPCEKNCPTGVSFSKIFSKIKKILKM